MAEHLDSCIDKESAKHAEDPFKLMDDGGTSKDEDTTQYQGTENAPEKNFVLIFPLDTEEGEEHQKYEKVIHRQ